MMRERSALQIKPPYRLSEVTLKAHKFLTYAAANSTRTVIYKKARQLARACFFVRRNELVRGRIADNATVHRFSFGGGGLRVE